ncbi:MAG: sigma-70 family RNA polymerase sigma factor [Actinomycetota bacterium]|nr:sigma-70 family RNA polymerase sigma factor [Actinomycetota bacterium]
MADVEPGVLAKAQAGDRNALDQLLRLHQPAVYAVCRQMLGNEPDAFDAMQDALVAIVRGLGRFDGRSKLSTWIYRIATNASLDEIRRRQRRPIPGLPDEHHAGQSQQGRVDEQVVARVIVDRALQEVPLDFRVAVVLRDLCSLDYAEIADVLDIAPGTVRSRIARGRAALADQLGGNLQGAARRQTPRP